MRSWAAGCLHSRCTERGSTPPAANIGPDRSGTYAKSAAVLQPCQPAWQCRWKAGAAAIPRRKALCLIRSCASACSQKGFREALVTMRRVQFMQLLTVCTWAVHSVPVRVCAMPTGGVRQLCERTTPGSLSQHSQVEPSCCLRLYRVAACSHRPAAVQLPKAHSSDVHATQ